MKKQIIAPVAILCLLTGAAFASEKGEEAEKPKCEKAEKTATSFSGGAHWYGKELHGHRTASGVPFDKDGLTAAHPSLKFGTKVKVLSKLTGKSVVVEINDRCPVRSYRCIDLSEGAAKQIGIFPHKRNDVECSVVK